MKKREIKKFMEFYSRVLKADEFNFECCCYYVSIYMLIRGIYNKILDRDWFPGRLFVT